jgi:signal transduction histidine kinase
MFHQHGAEWLGEIISVLAVLGIGIVVSALVEREERVRRESVAAEGRLELLDMISTGLTRLSNASELLDWVLNSLADSFWLDAAGFSPAREIRWLSPIVRGQADSETERMKTISGDIEGKWVSGSEVHPTSVPVVSDRVRFGTLRVMPAPDSKLDARDVELLAIVGQALGIALDNVRLQEMERENLQIYAREVTRAQEEERKRIARNLHDAAAQSLIVLSRGLDALAQVRAIPNEAAEQLEKLRTMALEALEGIRNAGSELRPSILDDLGIASAIEWLVRQIADRSDFKTDCIISGRRRRLASDTELAVFRIAQEALHNVNRHSEATHVQVALTFQDTLLSLEVQDNGKGFDLEHVTGAAAIGLTNMRERADLVQGRLTIASVPERGTTVTLLVEA